ncbi:hypothetical protein M378DRAFT_176386 [Amanita muscaria Koide BX008]|uniref:Uncharacterized protein n=1 Tax=Amanita muscaria (strain Koide BX008) TaxID=946122 RepID=A0A0C2XH34_AMAMK|nr:hypothetical protein M378DRAFT_176386 [Amanita muscaria Koide BX008]
MVIMKIMQEAEYESTNRRNEESTLLNCLDYGCNSRKTISLRVNGHILVARPVSASFLKPRAPNIFPWTRFVKMANKGKPFSDSDVAYPRITFHAPGRTFDRLLEESSLSDLKETVGKKLGLGSGSVVQFAQLRNGQLVDLVDENDFDAFCAVAHKQSHATLQVVLTENSIAEDSSVDAKGSGTSPLPPTPATALPGYRRLNANSSTSHPGAAAPRTKAVRIEPPEQRLDEEEQKEKEAKAKASPEEMAKREDEEEERRKEKNEEGGNSPISDAPSARFQAMGA